MKIKYRAVYYGSSATIKPEEIIKETALMVFMSYGKQRKETDYHSYHDTWEAAHAWLMERSEKEVVAARHRLNQANGVHGNVKGMKEGGDK